MSQAPCRAASSSGTSFSGATNGRRTSLSGLVQRLLPQKDVGQRLQAALAGDRGSRAPFGLVGQVQVFQLLLVLARLDLAAQRGRQLPLLVDRFQDGRLALGQFSCLGERVLDGPQGLFVQALGCFFAIACDKRDRVAGIQQFDRRLNPPRQQLPARWRYVPASVPDRSRGRVCRPYILPTVTNSSERSIPAAQVASRPNTAGTAWNCPGFFRVQDDAPTYTARSGDINPFNRDPTGSASPGATASAHPRWVAVKRRGLAPATHRARACT